MTEHKAGIQKAAEAAEKMVLAVKDDYTKAEFIAALGTLVFANCVLEPTFLKVFQLTIDEARQFNEIKHQKTPHHVH